MLQDPTTLWMVVITILVVFPTIKSFIDSRKGKTQSAPETFMAVARVSSEIFAAVQKVLNEGEDLNKLRAEKGDQTFYVELARRSKKIIEESPALSLLEKSFILTITLKHLAAIIEDLLSNTKSAE